MPSACVSYRDAAPWERATGTPPPQLSLGGRAIARHPTATGSVSRMAFSASRTVHGFAWTISPDRNRAGDATAGFASPGAGGRHPSIALTAMIPPYQYTPGAGPNPSPPRRLASAVPRQRARTYVRTPAAPPHEQQAAASAPPGQARPVQRPISPARIPASRRIPVRRTPPPGRRPAPEPGAARAPEHRCPHP